MTWINDFENKFNIHAQSDEFKLIIGIRPYKQKLGNKKLAIDITTNTTLQNTLYNGFNEIAFLVRDWVKIQSSLEMIFNLLSGTSSKSLEILAWLRGNKISPIEFAEYLLNVHDLMLVNKEDSKGNCISFKIKTLVRTINSQNQKVNILFTGSIFFSRGIRNNNGIKNDLGWVYHPSSYNLNKSNINYEDIWYNFNQNEVKNTSKTKTVKLNKFMIFK
jgi:hypothetical protein